jgi:phosphoadenosine phosphosulfate reductase
MSLAARVSEARRLLAIAEKNHSPAAFASSFGAEDMVVLDLIARDGLAIRTFTLQTGRLPKETVALIAEVRKRYGIRIDEYAPWPESVDAYVAGYGIDGFYDGVAQRKACCAVRKLEPLRRALAGKRAWVTGLRREQADSRAAIAELERDDVHHLWKYNPLVNWTDGDVWQYLRDNRVPYNALHDRGYPSIGCEPCTRAIKPGEHPRAGRWWWEQDGARKECGLHEIPVKVIEQRVVEKV